MSTADRTIVIRAPGRLHFGLFSFGVASERQFGGAGAMIAEPFLEVVVRPSDSLTASGPQAERAESFARAAARHWGLQSQPPCHIEVRQALPAHVGLGSGTQLAMAVAAGLNASLGGSSRTAAELALAVGRGARSSVGLHGFERGGLIVEAGHAADGLIGPLVGHSVLPDEWRFVLAWPGRGGGLQGDAERRAFERLPSVPAEVTRRLSAEALLHLLPAAVESAFDEFSASLYRYNHLAGQCFLASQGGPYARPDVVARLRAQGVEGVGQSSWGPLVFAVAPNTAHAEQIATELRASVDDWRLHVMIAASCNSPASLRGPEHPS